MADLVLALSMLVPGSWGTLASLGSHRWVRLQGTTAEHLVQPPCLAGLSWMTWHRVVSRQFLSIYSEGDSAPSLDNLFQCHLHGEEVLLLLPVELPVHHSNTLRVASCPVAWCRWAEPGSILLVTRLHTSMYINELSVWCALRRV